MKIDLVFRGEGEPSLNVVAETEAERSILAFLAEGHTRRWKCSPVYAYRAGGVERVSLVVDPDRAGGEA